MGLIKEFKEFALKGNVMDMAVSVLYDGCYFHCLKISFLNAVKRSTISSLTLRNSGSISSSVPLKASGSSKPICSLCITLPVNTGHDSLAPPHTVMT